MKLGNPNGAHVFERSRKHKAKGLCAHHYYYKGKEAGRP